MQKYRWLSLQHEFLILENNSDTLFWISDLHMWTRCFSLFKYTCFDYRVLFLSRIFEIMRWCFQFPSTECKICQNWRDCIQSLTFLRKTKPKDSPSPLHRQFIQVVHNEALVSSASKVWYSRRTSLYGSTCVGISTKKNKTKRTLSSNKFFGITVKVSTREVESCCWKDYWDL